MQPAPAIVLDGLSRSFGDVAAVSQLSFSVEPGEIFGIVGPDGAGKSTTMRMLAGILPPTGGTARVAGCDVASQADELREHIAYMSQQFGLYTDLSVMENIDFYAELYGVPRRGRAARVDELLGFSNMQPFKKRLAGNLSGGMKQKLQLICALIHTPQVLLLDEPTNGVDPVSRRDFWRILYQLLRQGVTIFVSTAYLDEAERCNRIAMLHEGRLLALGSPRDVRKLLGGEILELRSPHARQLAAALRGSFPPEAVTLFGDRVHLRSISMGESRAQAEAAAGRAGVAISDIRKVEPSLEDVFIGLLDKPLVHADE